MMIRSMCAAESFGVGRIDMRHIRVQWLHTCPDEPATLYCELDDEGWEIRKVEIFPDGRIGFASAEGGGRPTVLGEKPVPPLEDIAADPQFRLAMIGKEEFESLWARRMGAARSTA
jgi:hypothetical protein